MKDKITNFEIFDLFKNEYIIKMNQYRRIGVQISKTNCIVSVLKNKRLSKTKDLLYKLKYTAASFVNLLYILFSPRHYPKKDIFLFSDIRHTKKNYNNLPQLRIGLYNFRYFKHPHILSILSKYDIIKASIQSFISYQHIKKDIDQYAININQDREIFVRIIGFSFIRYLDIYLMIFALKQCSHLGVHYAGHFDIYASLLSLLRKKKIIKYLCGYQHGCYEIPRLSIHYNKFYTDKYILMFNESKKYFIDSLNGNDGCIIEIRESTNFTRTIALNKQDDEKLVVFAMQADNYDLDEEIISKLINKYNDSKTKVVCYMHPVTSIRLLKQFQKKFPDVIFEKESRYNNVDILYTRYSTIGIEYMRQFQNTQVNFIESTDEICIFYDSKKIQRVVL